jgi:hypothetical protein
LPGTHIAGDVLDASVVPRSLAGVEAVIVALGGVPCEQICPC